MAMLTDNAIRKAITETKKGTKARTLADAGRRGDGRLVLIVRPMGDGLAEWYARQIVDGSRKHTKLGTYPTMSLAEARRAFGELVPVIRDKKDIKIHTESTRREHRELATFEDVCRGYCDHLAARGARSAAEVERYLLTAPDAAAKHIMREKKARDITPAEVAAWLRPIFKRGASSKADQARRWLSAAYSWAGRAEYDYRQDVGQALRFGITSNPAAMVPPDTAARRAGTRKLSPDEVRLVWHWLMYDYGRTDPRACDALRLILATGQRVEEIMRISRAHLAEPGLIRWSQTKTGKPHAIPLGTVAAGIIATMRPNSHGLYVPGVKRTDSPYPARSLDWITRRCAKVLDIPPFAPRDLRRTWRTLATDAGLTKEQTASIMNHAHGSRVEAKHYDHSDDLPVKLAGMTLWDTYLAGLIGGI